MQTRVKILGLALGVLLAGTACSNQTVRDLEGVPIQDPEKIDLTVSVDQFPNVVSMCVHGLGFVSTTRVATPAALMRIPEWDAAADGWCSQP